MSKVAVVYWSGTGNTEAMANAVAEGVQEKGGACDVLTPGQFDESKIADYTAFAFGCSSMGAEELEEAEFLPMWEGVKGALAGKSVALFGSYGWGDGEWMRTWEAECGDAGIDVSETFICNEMPDDDAVESCKAMGGALV